MNEQTIKEADECLESPNEESPSIIYAIINWHKANPEMHLKSKDEQWKEWLRWEQHCRSHRDFASWHRDFNFTTPEQTNN
jgi:hypothetical protein